jgi:hypothetical protein
MQQNNEFSDLARRARQGDANAAALLKGELLPHLERIVGRALRVGGQGSNAMERVALSHARRLTSDPRQPKFDSPEHLRSLVARRMAGDVAANNAAFGIAACRLALNLADGV